MTLEEKIDLLLNREVLKTRFASLQLNAAMLGGVAIGQGKCRGVILSMNFLQLYTDTLQTEGITNATLEQGVIYYGDSQQQSKELLLNAISQTGGGGGIFNANENSTPIIFCEDLSEVFVRYSGAGNAETVQIELEIYYTGEPNFTINNQ